MGLDDGCEESVKGSSIHPEVHGLSLFATRFRHCFHFSGLVASGIGNLADHILNWGLRVIIENTIEPI